MVQIKVLIISLISFVVFTNFAQAKVDAIICKGQVYSLDYMLLKNHSPYGPLIGENDIPAGSLPYMIYMIAIFEKAVPELRPALNMFIENLKNETDFSKQMYWQASGLALPKETLLVKDWPDLAECSSNGKIEAVTIVQPIAQGQSIAFEYDQKLFSALKISNRQLNFLYMGTLLRLISDNLISLSNINTLIHSVNTIGLSSEALVSLFTKFGMKKQAQQQSGVCGRSNYVVAGLQKSTGLPCEIINTQNLLEVEELVIEPRDDEASPRWRYQSQDFAGLNHLRDLTISGFEKEFESIPTDDLAALTNIKKLAVVNSETNTVPLNFMNALTGLTYLDLSNNNIFEFKENVFRKIFIQQIGIEPEVVLNLSNNNSRWKPARRVYVHPGTFNNCQAVTKLLMSNMNITKLDGSVFSSLTSLKELDLSHNYITQFPWEIVDLPNLKILHICARKDKQKEITDELQRRKKSLDIRWCE